MKRIIAHARPQTFSCRGRRSSSIRITYVCGAWDTFWVGGGIVLGSVSSHCTGDCGRPHVEPPILSQKRGEPPLLHPFLVQTGEDISVIQLGRISNTGNEGQGAVAVDILTDSFSLCLESLKLTSLYFSY